ncbi:hypothetical protein RBA41_01205 [Massilia sp. CCM 9210]|uniref:hypothetical protein n=1 Tax=Massilia scottii TaxID=3057166 RepID=UPI0027966F16|nr:hypothetical protein [Massilia sp. CCM 9210]MDQ1811911.1 hypothetical protein [Massilia sp. CCM 9210]
MSCPSFFKEYIEWVAESPRRQLWCTFTSNRTSGVCSYAAGSLQFTPAALDRIGPLVIPRLATLEGNISQVFSDRRNGAGQNFSGDAADSLGLRITLSDPPGVRITLHSWGGARSSFSVECREGVLVGTMPGTGIVISLQKRELPA